MLFLEVNLYNDELVIIEAQSIEAVVSPDVLGAAEDFSDDVRSVVVLRSGTLIPSESSPSGTKVVLDGAMRSVMAQIKQAQQQSGGIFVPRQNPLGNG